MADWTKRCCLWLFSIVFLIATIFSLFIIVGLAAASIIFAQISDDRYIDAINNAGDDFEDLWYYYMIGSSGGVIPYSIFGTLAITLLVEAIRSTRGHKKRKPKNNSSSLTDRLGDLARPGVEDVDGVQERIDTIHNVPFVQFSGAPLAPATFGSILAVFLSLLLSSIGLISVFWGIAIAYNNARHVDKDVWPYILVEFIVGLVMPILVVLAAVLFSVFLEYVTQGSIDPRVLISRLLPVIKLLKGEKYEYWSILDRFYFQLSSHDSMIRSDKPAPCYTKCSHSPSTWIITVIVALAFLLSVSYFMNSNITTQTTQRSCPPQSGPEVDCFNTSSFTYVDCTDPNIQEMNFTVLHCFRFLRFGRDSDVIGGLSRAFAFYLATLAFFTTAFHIADILINFQPTRLWGLGFIIFGIILFIGGVAVMLTEEAVLLRLDVIKIFQFYMVAIFVFLVGLLMLISKWWEKVPGTKSGLVSPGLIPHKSEFKKAEANVREHAV